MRAGRLTRAWRAASRVVPALAVIMTLTACDELVALDGAGLQGTAGAEEPGTAAPPDRDDPRAEPTPGPEASPTSTPSPQDPGSEEPTRPGDGEESPRPPPSGGDRSGLTLESTFEDGDIDEWAVSQQACEYSQEIVDDVVRAGSRAIRFEMRPEDREGCGDYDGPGREAYGGAKSDLRADAPDDQSGDHHYGFSVFLPDGFAESVGSGSTILFQVHAGFAAKPTVALVAKEDRLFLDSSQEPQGCSGGNGQDGPSQDLGPIADWQGGWFDFVVHLDLDLDSEQDRAQLFARRAGEPEYRQVAALEGSIGYCDLGPARIGIYNPRYRSAPEKHDGATVVYFDEYREGTSFSAVEADAAGEPRG